MMAALLEECESGRDDDNSRISITGHYTGAQLDLGFYSRLRDVNEDSSFTVLG